MPEKANVMISRDNDHCHIVVEGRATFDCSPPLKNFADSVVHGALGKISVDLKACAWMDSTFMGTLATLGLRARQAKIDVELENVGEQNLKLLRELGILKLFVIKGAAESGAPQPGKWEMFPRKADRKEMAKTVLEAHETLMQVDEKNIPKFKTVVDFAKKDLEKED